MRNLTIALTFVAIARSASSQQLLLTIPGMGSGDQFGYAVAAGADMNGDGIPDFVAGARDNDLGGAGAGSATLHSGAGGAQLYQWTGSAPGDAFGVSVAFAGDADGDGFVDIAVGASKGDGTVADTGTVTLISGMNKQIVWIRFGGAGGDFFGARVNPGCDVDQDGFADILASAPGELLTMSSQKSGALYLLSGQAGATIYKFSGDATTVNFSESSCCPGDLNGDGITDLVGGCRSGTGTGMYGTIRSFSGATGAVLYQFNGINDSSGMCSINPDYS